MLVLIKERPGDRLPKIHDLSEGIHGFYCPACGCCHAPDGKWSFNGDYDKPTFSPSILVRTGHYLPEHKGDACWCSYNKEHPDDPVPFKCSVCHSFVTDGKIQYLADCTHELAGQTIEIPNWDDW